MDKIINTAVKRIAVIALAVAMFGAFMPIGTDAVLAKLGGNSAVYAQAKSKKTSNRIRHTMYKAKVKALYKKYKRDGFFVTQIRYKFVDLNGDGLHEMLLIHDGFGPQASIFTVYSKKVRMVWEEEIRGGQFQRIFKKAHVISYYHLGYNGIKSVVYLKFAKKKATPKYLAGKKWNQGQVRYWIGNKKIIKSQYNRYVKKITKGKRGTKVKGWSVYKGR